MRASSPETRRNARGMQPLSHAGHPKDWLMLEVHRLWILHELASYSPNPNALTRDPTPFALT